MIRPVRSTISVHLAACLVGLAILAAACGPSVGALGSPATPPATGEPSVEVPSLDATPGTPAPSVTAGPSATASAAASSGAPTGSPATTTSPTAKPTAEPAVSGTTIVRAYFFLGSFTDNAGLAPVLREIPSTKAVATAAMRALLAGPNDTELGARPAMYTDIPDGTRLLGITIDKGVATVDLSREFGTAARTFSQSGAIAQVVYTLTQFPTVTSVRIGLDGTIQAQAFERSDFTSASYLPAIFVDRPAWGAALGNPGHVAGSADVFEATFRVQVLDAAGHVLADRQVMASCGTGCWGTFDTQVPYTVSRAQWGTLRVFDRSAKDGSPENVTEYPVWITPKS